MKPSRSTLVSRVFLTSPFFVPFSYLGNDGSQFFGITTELGPGFFILIAYSVFGGMLHFFFNMRLLLEEEDVDK